MGLQDASIHVLLIEDDTIDIRIIEYAFQKYNIKNTLDIVENGDEAFDKLYGRNGIPKLIPTPKIIFLDINTPKMSGFEFLKKLRQDPEFSTIPVFIITTSDADSDRKTAAKFNVLGYFLKPLNMAEVLLLYKSTVEKLT